jgi:hypothetical protein
MREKLFQVLSQLLDAFPAAAALLSIFLNLQPMNWSFQTIKLRVDTLAT